MHRLLVLGTGGMAHTHADAFSKIANCQMVAAVDINAENLAKFCKTYCIENSFSSLEEAIAWNQFDAALNVTPDAIHHPTSLALAKAGKHIFCEKPLAGSFPLADEMTKAVEASNLVGMVNLTYRNSAAIQKAHELVHTNEIGEIKHFEASYNQSWLVGNHWGDWRTEKMWLWRVSEEHGSLGVLGDVGIHILDFACFGANSMPTEISCRLKTFHKAENDQIGEYPLTANDSAVMHLELENGAIGVVHASRFATGYANCLKLVLHGDKGAIKINLDESWDHLDICRGDNIHTQAWERLKLDPVKTNYQRFIDALDEGQSLMPDFRRASELQRVLDLCVSSDKERASQAV